MKPSEYLRHAGRLRDIEGLQKTLLAYVRLHGDDIEQLKAITPPDKMSEETMRRINEYETEVRIAQDALANWKEGIDGRNYH